MTIQVRIPGNLVGTQPCGLELQFAPSPRIADGDSAIEWAPAYDQSVFRVIAEMELRVGPWLAASDARKAMVREARQAGESLHVHVRARTWWWEEDAYAFSDWVRAIGKKGRKAEKRPKGEDRRLKGEGRFEGWPEGGRVCLRRCASVSIKPLAASPHAEMSVSLYVCVLEGHDVRSG